MATVTLKGTPFQTTGELPKIGEKAPEFTLTGLDLQDKTLADFAGKKVILNIFPSVDTPTCAASVRHFNKDASSLENAVVLCISKDLPFAQKRFCGAEGLENVISLSEFKNNDFATSYGLLIKDGPLVGLHSRAVVVIDENGKVIYTEQITETADEPNYEAALNSLK